MTLPKPYFKSKNIIIYHGDCLDILPELPDEFFDSVITDPPYGLTSGKNSKKGFMGKEWDSGVPGAVFWEAVLRVCKPGCIMLAFGGTRTFHRLACNIEDAGWELRDCLMHLFGTGFPKGYSISRGIDKKKGLKQTVIGADERFKNQKVAIGGKGAYSGVKENKRVFTTPASDEAKLWEKHNVALKPAFEPILLCMKKLDKNYVHNALTHGVAGLNIDECRIGISDGDNIYAKNPHTKGGFGSTEGTKIYGDAGSGSPTYKPTGRWPANVLLSHHPDCKPKNCDDDCSVKILDKQSGITTSDGATRFTPKAKRHQGQKWGMKSYPEKNQPKDKGGASRFFKNIDNDDCQEECRFQYVPKASKRERGEYNNHPTVKPLRLLQWLARLTKTPTGGIVLDPFMGSGSTALACIKEGRKFIGIEKEEEYCEIVVKRIKEELES